MEAVSSGSASNLATITLYPPGPGIRVKEDLNISIDFQDVKNYV